MSFSIAANELATALKPIGAMIPKTCFKDEHECIHFIHTPFALTAIAYNEDSQSIINMCFSTQTPSFKMADSGFEDFRIKAAKLLKMLAGFKKADISFSVVGKKLVITANGIACALEFEPATLAIPSIVKENVADYDGVVMVCGESQTVAIRNAYVFADKNYMHPNTHGVYIEYNDTEITAIAATDTHILFAAGDISGKGQYSGIIHYIAVGILAKIFNSAQINTHHFVLGKKKVEIFGKTHTSFIIKAGAYTLYTKDVDTKFVPFRSIIRNEHTTVAMVLRSDLAGIIKSFIPHVNKYAHQLFYNFRKDKMLEICCKNVDTKFLATAKADCMFESEADSCIIALGCTLLQRVLSTLPAECTHVKFQMSTGSSAVFISDYDLGDASMRVIMPVMLGNSLSEKNWDTFTSPELTDFEDRDS